MGRKPNVKKLLLDAITLNARALRDTNLLLSNLIARAVEQGVPQTEVAKAAGVSQAHVSRTLAAYRKRENERKATRRAKRRDEVGTV